MADELTYEAYLQQQIEAYNAAKAGSDEREKAAREIGVLYMSAKDGLFQLNTDHPVTHTQEDWARLAQTKVLTAKGESVDTSTAYDHAFVTTPPGHDAAERAGEIVGRLAKGENIDLTPTIPVPLPPSPTQAPFVAHETAADLKPAEPKPFVAHETAADLKPAESKPAADVEVTTDMIAKLEALQKKLEGAKGKASFVGDGGIEKGEDVKLVQQALLAMGEKLPQYGADGDAGLETDAAIRSFQAKHDKTVDGDMGKGSLPALIEEVKKELEKQKTEKAVTAGKAAEDESQSVAKDAEKAKAKETEDKSITVAIVEGSHLTPETVADKLGVDADKKEAFVKDHGSKLQNGDAIKIDDPAKYGITHDEAVKAQKETELEVSGKGIPGKDTKKSKAPEAGPYTPPAKAPRQGREDMPEDAASVAKDAEKAKAKEADDKSITVAVAEGSHLTPETVADKLGVDADKKEAFVKDHGSKLQNGDAIKIDDPAKYGITHDEAVKAQKETELEVSGKGIPGKDTKESKAPEAGPYTPPAKAPRQGREDMPEDAASARNADEKETVKVTGMDLQRGTLDDELAKKGKALGMSDAQALEFAKAVQAAAGGSSQKISEGVEVDMDKFNVAPANYQTAKDHGVDIAEKGGRA